jgi:hypothetical protein
MKYQLVAQWPSNSVKEYDAMIEAEETLIEHLTTEHEVDGHDAGSGETNIFILTDDFERAFIEVKSILQAQGFWEGIRIAYREVGKSQYSILWPKGLKEFSVT